MSTSGYGSRAGATTGDVLIILAVLSLGASILYPITRQRAFEERVAAAVADVESLRSEALRLRDSQGAWPESAPTGELPPGSDSPGLNLVRESYTLQWSRWVSVELPQPDTSAMPPPDDEDNPPPAVPIPRPLVSTSGGITVHTAEADLLAELLNRYGASSSFVRDTSWTLVLPSAGAPPDMRDADPAAPLNSPFRRRD